MLSAYNDLFSELKRVNCRYCIYKGIEHLRADLVGARGDLDVLVCLDDLPLMVAALNNAGFYESLGHLGFPKYFVSREDGANTALMVDLDVELRPIKNKPYSVKLGTQDWNNLDVREATFGNVPVNILAGKDLLIVYLLYKKYSKIASVINWIEGENGYSHKGQSTLKKILVKNSSAWTDDLGRAYPNAAAMRFLGENTIKQEKYLTFSAFRNLYLRRLGRLKAKVLGEPMLKLNKRGLIIAFVGVDGSGKSTLVDGLLQDEFYKRIGVKRIYFGGKEYRLKKIESFVEKNSAVPLVSLGCRYLLSLERQARVLKALWYKYTGHLVLCDRYFYDDVIRQRRQKRDAASVWQRLKLELSFIFKPKLSVIPDLVFYLKITPELAYSRKQEFDYSILQQVCEEYDAFMVGRKEVVLVDSSLAFEEVKKLASSEIMAKCFHI